MRTHQVGWVLRFFSPLAIPVLAQQARPRLVDVSPDEQGAVLPGVSSSSPGDRRVPRCDKRATAATRIASSFPPYRISAQLASSSAAFDGPVCALAWQTMDTYAWKHGALFVGDTSPISDVPLLSEYGYGNGEKKRKDPTDLVCAHLRPPREGTGCRFRAM